MSLKFISPITLIILTLMIMPLVIGVQDILVTPLDNEIRAGETATFQVTITNSASGARTYTLYGLDVVWSVDPEDRSFTLASHESKTTTVRVRPLGPFQPSTYSVKLYVDTALDSTLRPLERFSSDLSIVLYPEEPVQYMPAVKETVEMNEKVNPQTPLPITVTLQNRNRQDLPGLTLRIQSEMKEFNKEALVDLAPLGGKTVGITITPNPYQQPKEYTLFFILEWKGEPVKVVEKHIEIIPMVTPFVVQDAPVISYFKQEHHLTVTNDGNVRNTQEIRWPISSWAAFVTMTITEKENKVENGQHYFVWEETLGPHESVTLDYTTNYRLPIYALLLIIVLCGLYVWFRSPAVLEKAAKTLKGTDEGVLSEIKVTLQVRNVSKKALKNVKITDVVPGIANLEKSLDIGSMKPDEIKHTATGTKVIWDIPELEPLEHRLITYTIRAKLNILGTFSLPRATLEHSQRGRGRRKTYSNVAKLG